MSSSIEDRIAALPPHLREQMRRRLSGRSQQADAIRPADRSKPLPLSFPQQRLWFLDSFQPGGSGYNSALALRLTGSVDVAALTAALTGLVARHESLRTTLDEVDGVGVQVVHPPFDLALPVAQAQDDLDELLVEEYSRPFDLRQGPLVRALLVRLAQDEHVLLVTAHHVVTDGWSMGVLTEELGELYGAAVAGREAVLPALPLQYADFAAWQRERLSGDALRGQVEHWTRRLSGTTPLELPTDRPRPPVRTTNGAVQSFTIPATTTAALRALAHDRGTILFSVLMAGCQALLARYAGQDDVAVGTVTTGRGRPGLERLVGFFVNTVVLRSTVDSRVSFAEFLDQVKENVKEAYAHDEVPLEHVVDALRVERDVSRNPLFDVMVLLQNAERTPPTLPGLAVDQVGLSRRDAIFDLTIEFQERDGLLDGVVEYNTDLFDATTIARLTDHLVRLLGGAAADPRRPLGELPWLSEAERDQVLVGWNDAHRAPVEDTITGRFAEQARRTPDAPAVVFDDVVLTYAELDAQANRLAGELIGLGVRPEDPVGLLVERSADLVVAELAVLKAGAAYVPLDGRAPVERTRRVLADSGIAVVLTDPRNRDVVTSVHTGQVVVLDGDRTGAADPAVVVHPDQLAYVMHTSGSTGVPKGVAVRHRDVVALALDSRFATGAHDRVLLHSPSAFDASTYELWVPLLRGGQVVVARPGDVDADAIRDAVAHGVTAIWLTAGLFRLVAQEAPEAFAGLREVWTGGDVVPAAAVRGVLAACPGLTVVDGYGPTETTTFATSFPMTDTVPDVIPIGRPLDGMAVYVLDEGLRPVPVGVPGELFLAGAGVARGYLGQPGLTAERFLPDPFGPPGSRMYRTGDIGRWRAHGVVEFVGRTDDQVKIRGFRVETGEIDALLVRHPEVAQSITVARTDDGRKQLVAYLVPAAGTVPAHAELRTWLTRELPDYMVPSAFVVLDALPLSGNGKVDRRALPAPEAHPAADRHVEPTTPVERELARVWAEVLRVDRVGIEDNFFELGGDSILSIQLVARARRAGIRLSSKDVFLHPTVAELAATASAVADSVPDAPVAGPAPLTPIQEWFFETAPASPHHFTMSTHVELAPDLDERALATAVDAVVAHHDALRTRFTRAGDGQSGGARPGETATPGAPTSSRWVQDLAPTAPTGVLRVRDLAGLDGPAQEEAAQADALAAQSSLDLEAGPLIRAVLFRLGDRFRLFLTVHHLVVDGVSWRVLLDDIDTAYHQVVRGEPVALEPVTTAFATWARRLADRVAAGELDADLDHWTGFAASAPAELPVDHEDGDPAEDVRSVTVRLSPADTDALLHQVPGVYRTQVNDVLLSALGRALAEWTGRDRVLVGLEGHGREDVPDDLDVSRTVGWFTSQFPLALHVPAGEWGGVLKSVKEQVRALPRRGQSYAALQYLAAPGSPAAALRDDPHPLISFNYHGQWDVAADDDGLVRARCAPLGRDTAPGNTRAYLIDVVGLVENGRLELTWLYSGRVHDEPTVWAVADAMMRGLAEIVAHCAEPDAGGRTPSDFPLAHLGQAAVDRLVGTGADVEDVYPLTPLQEGMLFHGLADPSSTAYFDQVRLRLTGVADERALAAAWQRVVDRTPVLRGALVWEGVDRPVQVIRSRVDLPTAHHDWRELSEQDRERALEVLVAQELDLRRAPLMRIDLARLSDDEVLLVWTFHHVLLDGWSLAQVFAEVCEQYRALTAGSAPEVVSRRPFRDYLRWLDAQDRSEAERHWRAVLADFSAPTALPYDRLPARDHATESSTAVPVALTAEQTDRLRRTARRHGLTVNTVVQGAWALLLSRYSGESDVVFGTTVSGRPGELPGVEQMIGLFINTVPARVSVRADADVATWLGEVQAAQTESRRFDFVSLAELRSWSGVPAGSALFDSAVVFENYPLNDVAEVGGIQATEVQARDTTTFALTLSAVLDEQLRLDLAYDPHLFDADTARRLADRLLLLVDAIAADSARPVSDLPLMTGDERRLVLEEWNTAAADVSAASVVEVFEAQVRATPDATALVVGDRSLSFAELNAWANRVARVFVASGVGPERLVALSLPRSVEFVVALLAIWKAGGVYLPVDPSLPADRVAFLVQDAKPVLIVRDALPEADGYGSDDLKPVGPGNAAYVIYTSGSTGRPKGVAVEHGSLVNLLVAHREGFVEGNRLRVALSAVFSFDTSLEGIVLMADGHELHVLDDDLRLDPPALVRYVADQRIDFLDLTPSYARQLVEAGLLDGEHRPKVLMLGGEAIGEDLWRRLADVPGTASYNFYGPTESTVDALSVRITGGGRPVVGRPLPNVRAYVLDADLRPVPVGVPGELFLAGAQLARGYLGRAGLTADRFLADPFGGPGERMYRTGDRARWLADGTLDYLGRTDDQVKIRGHRVEPGEVEAALARHPEVREAVVIARQVDGHQRLVAYVTGAGKDLRAWLGDRLPDYLVPSAFVELDAIPLNANGKVDRRALPAPDFTEARAEHVAPRTDVERDVADIWSEVLGVPGIGVRDNFFELGGDSLLSIRVISRLRAAFDVEMSPRALFTHPTVAGIAALVAESAQARLDEIPVVPRDGGLPLSFAQQRLWFLDEFEPGGVEYLSPSVLRLRGPLDVDALAAALTALVARHESLRTTFDTVDGHGVQVVHPPQPVEVPVVEVTEEELADVLTRETTTPFDLARPAGAGAAGPAEPGRPRALPGAAPHRDRRLVQRRAAGRAGCLLRGRDVRQGREAARPAGAVRRLRGVATQRLDRGGVAGAPGALEARVGRRAAAGAADRPAPAGRPRQAGRAGALPGARRGHRPAQGLGPRARRHPVHGTGRRLPGGVLPLVGAAGRRRRHGRLRPRPHRAGGPGRVLRQHAGAQVRSGPGAGLRTAARPGPGDGARRVRPPGRAVRTGRGRGAPRARPQPHPAVPGDGRAAEHRWRRTAPAGPARRGAAATVGRGGLRRVVPVPGVRRPPGGGADLRHRVVRHHHGRAAGGARRRAARRRDHRARPRRGRPAAAHRRRARDRAGEVERHRHRGPGTCVPRGVPGPRRPHAGRDGPGRRRAVVDLRRAQRAGQPHRPPPDRGRCRTGVGGGTGVAAVGRAGARDPGRAEGGRRVRAGRPGAPGGADRVRAGRRPATARGRRGRHRRRSSARAGGRFRCGRASRSRSGRRRPACAGGRPGRCRAFRDGRGRRRPAAGAARRPRRGRAPRPTRPTPIARHRCARSTPRTSSTRPAPPAGPRAWWSSTASSPPSSPTTTPACCPRTAGSCAASPPPPTPSTPPGRACSCWPRATSCTCSTTTSGSTRGPSSSTSRGTASTSSAAPRPTSSSSCRKGCSRRDVRCCSRWAARPSASRCGVRWPTPRTSPR
ncbi:hypothetical protein BBK82_35180 [Lentzea guizhouensis]|uniref:Carrier domain-containing protein n=1 Tax=Lentzea guizhouensis TaxID=1586287 RepID=A0A1B2HS05_9PSEU|nr:hypothetical protein BBK82_35180 [Lentzea guizhouensis]